MALSDESQLVREQIKTDIDEHVARIQEAIRQPSESIRYRNKESYPELRAICGLVRSYLDELGCEETTLVETAGAPGVWGYYDAGAEKTIVNYGYLDTRSVIDEGAWDHDPFGGKLVEMDSYEEVLVGRQANKGSFVAWINSLFAAKKALGELPVNIMFLVEAEEMNGSPYYDDMLDQYEGRLQEADVCLCPLAGQAANGDIFISLGWKGGISFDLLVSGEEWERGPQGGLVHSTGHAVVESPAWRLIEAISCLTEDNGSRVAIDGYYDQYEEPSVDERQEVQEFLEELREGGYDDLWKLLPGTTGDGTVNSLRNDLHEDVEEAFLTWIYGPEATLNLQGINTGFLGPETDTRPWHIPHEGRSTFEMRLPRGIDPSVTARQLRGHLDSRGFDDIKLTLGETHGFTRTYRDTDLVKAVEETFASRGVDVYFWPYGGGGVPWGEIGHRFDIPVIFGPGMSRTGSKAELTDEYLVIKGDDDVGGLAECELSHFDMINEYAKK